MSERVCQCGGEMQQGANGLFWCPACGGRGAMDDPPEAEASPPQPIGVCPKCKTPVYTTEGFCGVCRGTQP